VTKKPKATVDFLARLWFEKGNANAVDDPAT
jgi:hypothetical protein